MKPFFKKGKIDRKAYDSLESDQQEMIRGIVELSGSTVKEVMIPRIDAVFLDVDTPQGELLETICTSGHSRFPVYQDTIDNVVGILYIKDVFPCLVKNEDFDTKLLVRPAYFVPDSKHIDELLKELRQRRVHIAIALDEYGGVSGIICMEDIIEEIIGDIQDEFDNETEDIIPLDYGEFLCDARVNLEDLAEKIGITFPEEEHVDTLGGFVFGLLGKIPVEQEHIPYMDYDFIVTAIDGHKINTIKIVKKAESHV
ncbi:MAG: hemolysin family protein [Treponema sp.]|jgi:CBS domain containing-hemolysin-like protein|nr:hemolysin family protein [Treponema sp.]